MGQEALDIKSKQEQLNQQKSDQIDAIKKADMDRKIADSNAKIEQAQAALKQKSTTADQQLKMHKDMADAVEERHKLEMAQKDMQFQITSKQHQNQIDAMQKRLDQAGSSTTTTELNADGTKKTVTTKKGSTVSVTGKDGKPYTIPADKLDDWNANHAGDSQ
jgi:site-specific recombinase